MLQSEFEQLLKDNKLLPYQVLCIDVDLIVQANRRTISYPSLIKDLPRQFSWKTLQNDVSITEILF